MKPIAILEDPSVAPLPSYTARDVRRALEKAGVDFLALDVKALGAMDRSLADVLVLPYLDGDLSGAPLDGILRFHKQGGGLVFLGDTPHVGRSFPYRNSQAPELRLTRCRDGVILRGLTGMGREILGDLPDWDRMLARKMSGLRTSAFAPDECHNLLVCEAGFKLLSPIVLVERRHPDFLGARAVVVGFDGGEPRENIMGVCDLPWTFDPGLLDREWAGADVMVARLVAAAHPPDVAFAMDFEPVVPSQLPQPVSVLARNLSAAPRDIILSLDGGGSRLLADFPATLAPGTCLPLAKIDALCPDGPQEFSICAMSEGKTFTSSRTRFGFLDSPDSPPLNFGFSVFRAFRSPAVDAPYRDFLHSTGKLGMQYVRMALAWEDLEPQPGGYVWDVPDQLLDLAASEGIPVYFWVFPTARGSGLSEGGVPEWTLREPAIDRDGKPGNFPCIWSPFYRERYFGFLEALARRYANDPRLARFVFDFGNSDFPYTYHYYGDRGDLFDYSPHEQAAFARWLEARGLPLDDLSRRWGREFQCYSDIPVPLSEQRVAWLLYEEFRTWGVHQGIKEAVSIIHRIAPDKAPPDFPGHGLGSIADIGTYINRAQTARWEEVQRQPHDLIEAHNMGPQWGGEAWQVGGRFPDYDDAVFQSVRLEADYLTIPGPDLGIWENDVARIAMLRRSLAGARRTRPQIAIIDRMAWNDWGSLCHIGVRLDQPVDLISRTCRYDFSCYDLLVMPPNEIISTSHGDVSLLPLDAGFYEMILEAVRAGLKVLVSPRTGLGDPLNPLRDIWGLRDVVYGLRTVRQVAFPGLWGGGSARGACHVVAGAPSDRVLLSSDAGEPVALFRPVGKGGFIIAGYDALEDSLDGAIRHDTAPHLRDHTLARLAASFGIAPAHIRTNQACCYKEFLTKNGNDFLIFYSHHGSDLPVQVEFRSDCKTCRLLELSSGTSLPVAPTQEPGWFSFEFTLEPQRGYYFKKL